MKGNKGKKALLICSRNNHYKVIKPVIEELDNRGWKTKTLRLEKLGETIIRTVNKSSLSNKNEIIKYTNDNKKRNKIKIFEKFTRIITSLLSFLMKIGIIFKPAILIVITDATFIERTFILTCKRLEIPSLRIQIGLIGSKHDQRACLVDKMAISGDITKELLTKICKIDKNRLVITGYPAYDKLAVADKNFIKEKICKNLKLDEYKKIIVFTTENLSLFENTTLAEIVCKAIFGIFDAQLVIKVHPGEQDCQLYKNIADKARINYVVTRDYDIHEILYIADLVITYFSATGLEAMVLNKPLITLNPFTENDPINYADSGAALKAKNEKELNDAIKRILCDEKTRESLAKNRNKYIYKQAYKQDGKSTKRVVELIEKMIR
jgi:hypothetical protein